MAQYDLGAITVHKYNYFKQQSSRSMPEKEITDLEEDTQWLNKAHN